MMHSFHMVIVAIISIYNCIEQARRGLFNLESGHVDTDELDELDVSALLLY